MPRTFVYRIGGTLDPGLTQAEQDNNILCIYDELKGNYGWTDEAIAGACGCIHEESHMNPGVYETGHGGNLNNLPYFPGGMGLCQWTDYPAYTAQYPNPLPWSADRENQNWYDGRFQCWLMTKADDTAYTSMGYGQGPRWGWLMIPQYYPNDIISWSNYLSYNGSVDQACRYWFFNVEWHYTEQAAIDMLGQNCITDRQAWARYAYDLFHGLTPDPPGPGPGPGPGPTPSSSRKMPLWMMLKNPWIH